MLKLGGGNFRVGGGEAVGGFLQGALRGALGGEELRLAIAGFFRVGHGGSRPRKRGISRPGVELHEGGSLFNRGSFDARHSYNKARC